VRIFPITGKITGNFFRGSGKAAWIAGFLEGHAQKQGINREFNPSRESQGKTTRRHSELFGKCAACKNLAQRSSRSPGL
jgi:hypothetical protein